VPFLVLRMLAFGFSQSSSVPPPIKQIFYAFNQAKGFAIREQPPSKAASHDCDQVLDCSHYCAYVLFPRSSCGHRHWPAPDSGRQSPY
jgi:hypothetical protein